jgi:hypothetical protein
MMKRILAVAGVVVSLGAVFGTVPAGAGPGNDVSVTLSCDKGVTATISVRWVVNSEAASGTFPGIEGVTCETRRISIPLGQPETAIRVTQFDVSPSSSCADPVTEVPLPARLDCGPKVGGAKLTVR